MFPDSILSEEARRIPSFEFIERVLLPEAAGRLIHEDSMGLQSLDECWEILSDSYSYGHYLFPEALEAEVADVVLEELREAVSNKLSNSVSDRILELGEPVGCIQGRPASQSPAEKALLTLGSSVGCAGPMRHVADHVALVDIPFEVGCTTRLFRFIALTQ